MPIPLIVKKIGQILVSKSFLDLFQIINQGIFHTRMSVNVSTEPDVIVVLVEVAPETVSSITKCI